MWGSLKVSLALSIPQVTHKAAAGEGSVDLEARGKEGIRKGNPGASDRWRWFRDTRHRSSSRLKNLSFSFVCAAL